MIGSPTRPLRPLSRESFRVRTWGDVFFVLIATWIVLLPLGFLPVASIELHHTVETGSTDYRTALMLAGSRAIDSSTNEDPVGEDAVRVLRDIDLGDAEWPLAVAAALVMFSLSPTRWSRGLRVLAALGWISGVQGVRYAIGSALRDPSVREIGDSVRLRWQWGFWVLVAAGVVLIAWAALSFRRPAATQPELGS